ncbi:hypothetical protein BH10PSE1_BH10PSE1_11110 [soil metagenome]
MRFIKRAKAFIGASRRSMATKASRPGPAAERYFDRSWYVARNPDVAAAGVDPLDHYLKDGWRELRAPHPMISPEWILARYPQTAGREPIAWFLEEGRAGGANLTPAFDLDTYRTANADLQDLPDLLDHFMGHGWHEGRPATLRYNDNVYRALNPGASDRPGHAMSEWVQCGAPELPEAEPAPSWITGDIYSYGFDRSWYLAKNADVAEAGLDPVEHYREHGWRELRSPHPMINPIWLNANVPETVGREPLQWFIDEGRESGHRLCPIFDEEVYRSSNPDLVDLPRPFEHFLAGGWREHRVFHRVFRASHYRQTNPDVAASSVRPAEHFVQAGLPEGRRLSPLFWPDWYADKAGLLPANQIALLDHYLGFGFSLGLGANPLMDQRWYEGRVREEDRGEACLSHYLRIGHARDMNPHPLFDGRHYRAALGEPIDAIDLYAHFLLAGDRGGLSANPLFDGPWYARSNPEAEHTGLGPLLHYVVWGVEQMCWPSPMFDPEHYAWNSARPDLARKEGLSHYVKSPDDRRHPHPLFDGVSYSAQSGSLDGQDALIHYLGTRSRLDPALIARHATGVPTPTVAPALPRRGAGAAGRKASRKTLVSVVMPIYQSSPDLLKRAIDSVRSQIHQAWELIVIDDGSPSLQPRRLVEPYVKLDPRIRLEVLTKNQGISRASNVGLELAKGEFVAFLDHDDVLTPDALSVMLDRLSETGADACYSDQSYITEAGDFASTFLKPAFSPTLMLGVMYFGHLLMVRRKLAKAIGGFDPAFDRLQDFEFMLRLSEKTDKIVHAPQVLYQWRMVQGSVAMDSNAKGRLEPLQAEAVNAYLKRRDLPIKARPGEVTHHRLVLEPDFDSRKRPEVEFLIRNDRPADAVRHAVNLCRTASPRARITTVGELAGKPASESGVAEGVASALREARSGVVVYVDPVVKSLAPGWLDHLLMHLADDTVIAAAPHLVDETDRVLAAGYVLDEAGLVPAMAGLEGKADGHAGSLVCDRDVSILNASVVAIKVAATAELGGLSSIYGGMLHAMADLTLRARSRGLRAVSVSGARGVIAALDFGPEAVDGIDALIFTAARAADPDAGDPFYNTSFARGGAFIAASL